MIGHVLLSMNEVITDNYSSSHQAIDVVGSGNSVSDVIAYGDGVVEMAVNNVQFTNHKTKGTATYGNYVKIKHPDGQKTLYAHLKYGSVSVSRGQSIDKGQKIGTMGATGNAYGTHLHFEVRKPNERRENPEDYLWGEAPNNEPTLATNTPKIEETKEKTKEEIKNDVPVVTEQTTGEVKEVPKENIKTNKKTENAPKTSAKQKEEAIVIPETNDYTYLQNSNYSGGSIVDGLKEIKIDSSFNFRTILAKKNGITNYRGTYEQNVKLLSLLKQGKLLKV